MGFTNQKGGVGKSKLNRMLAYPLYVALKAIGKKIILVDLDYIQMSIMEFRQDDMNNYLEECKRKFQQIQESNNEKKIEEYKKSLTEEINVEVAIATYQKSLEGQIKPFTLVEEQKCINEFKKENYPVASSDFANIAEFIKKRHTEFDVILCDFPGTLLADNIGDFYTLLDYVFVVFNTSDEDVKSTEKFVSMYFDKIAPLRKNKKLPVNIYGVLNRVSNNAEYRKLKAQMESEEFGVRFNNLQMLKTEVPESDQISSYKSTVSMAVVKGFKTGDVVGSLCKEVFSIIKKDIIK